jgi:endonuclease YncB( thermonuclease family)
MAVALPLLAPDTVSGVATAIDGDTIRVGAHMAIHVRIQGIAAPETYQPGGPEARARMHALVDGKVVICTIPSAAETHDRLVGACTVAGADIGGIMTEAGLARDCWAYSHGRYQATQAPAAKQLFLPGYCHEERRGGR